MKKILITGANSYIGTSFEKYIKDGFSGEYTVDTVDMIDGSWRKKSFSGYDIVFHVAGIVHIRETEENAELYYRINRDLAAEACKKAKTDGVRQFIFLSTMSVYGMDTGIITSETKENPKTNYGKSKLAAEKLILDNADKSFAVCILRPPMVYGKDCKGNFQSMVKLTKKFPILPKINNKRSLIYIENLCSFVKKAADNTLSGIFYPQNREYMNTTGMMKLIAEKMGKKRYFSYLMGLGVIALRPLLRVARKGFGSLIYKDMDSFGFDYCVSNSADSVKESV